MAPQPGVHIQHPAPQPSQLSLTGPLALGQAHQANHLGFAVMQHRPIGIAGEQTLQSLPQALLTMLLQGQQGLVAGGLL